MLDWSRLKAYQDAPTASFEELNYQIARVKFGHRGRLQSIDDSGGGDGVEFYLELPNGDEWGWQAKFYPHGRLTATRRKSIEKSLTRAVTVHGAKLKRWFLCVPLDLVIDGENSEDKWFRQSLPALAPGVDLVFWGASELFALLQDPGMVGVRHCFFGDLPLTPEWFVARLEEQLANLRDKYSASLHVETGVDGAAHALSADSAFLAELVSKGEELEPLLHALATGITAVEHAIATLARTGDDGPSMQVPVSSDSSAAASSPAREAAPAGGAEVLPVRTAHATDEPTSPGGSGTEDAGVEGLRRVALLQPILATARSAHVALGTLADALAVGDIDGAQQWGTQTGAAIDAVQSAVRGYYDAFKSPDGSLPSALYDALDAADTAVVRLERVLSLRRSLTWLGRAAMHVFGDAGIGKTHLSCHLVAERVGSDRPAILLLGSRFSGTMDLPRQILDQLGVPATYGFEDFLAALDAYAAARRTRALLVVDALNEAQSPAAWKQRLPGLVAAIARHPRLALVTTCRPLYRELIWGSGEPDGAITALGFPDSRIDEAIRKYFRRYRLRADLTFAPLDAFRHPLYLALFCRAKNPTAAEEREVVLGGQSLFDIFGEYLDHVDAALRERLGRVGSRVATSKLDRIAAELWARRSRELPFEVACELIDGRHPEELEWQRSLTSALLDEGLLLRRDLDSKNGREEVTFTYDLLAGYLIARHLVEGRTADSLRELVASEEFVRAVSADDSDERHPLAEDVLRGFGTLIPERTGAHLYHFATAPAVYSAGIRALFDAPGHLVKAADVTEVRRVVLEGDTAAQNFRALYGDMRRTVFLPGHPLNADFMTSVLAAMPLTERDLRWSEAVRAESERWLDEVRAFEQAARAASGHQAAHVPGTDATRTADRLHLAARLYPWLLTSTHRLLRDVATRALYWYGRAHPSEFFALTLDSFEVDDPYVRERLLAAGYGVAMALHADPGQRDAFRPILAAYARTLYERMFSAGAAHGTTHALVRDYARNTIEVARRLSPHLLTPEEAARITPPFIDGGIRIWDESEDRNHNEYRDGNYPLGFDFANYTLGHLVPGRSNYDAKHPEYLRLIRQVWWRIYSLGYSLEKFGEVDRWISIGASHNRSEENSSRVDRYGKKYAWIAYFEQHGLREDLGLFDARPWRDPRPSEADIDPSFPDTLASERVVTADLLGDRSRATDEWVLNGPEPDLQPWLVVESIAGEAGPWVLLDGFLSQEDRAANRTFFAFPRALLVRSQHAEELAERLAWQRLGGRWLPEIPTDRYLFAGEIPWSTLVPENGWTTLRFTGQSGSAELRTGVELGDEGSEAVEVMLPVREHGWEGFHSGANAASGTSVPARDIAEPRGLWLRLPTWDFYDTSGRRVTRYLRASTGLNDSQKFLYMRADMLGAFLADQGLALVWAVWGERNLANLDDILTRRDAGVGYVNHQRIYMYEDGGAWRVHSDVEPPRERG